MKKSTIIILAIIVIIVLAGVGYYNSLVKADQAVAAQWAQVENQFQRRFDLIPNLVEATKATLKQEQTVFGDIATARANYAGAVTINDKAAAATQVESALSRLLAIVENYPQLNSNDTIKQLMVQLEGTENRVATERYRFNDMVQAFNVKVKTFPGNLFANMFGFTAKEFFQAADTAQIAPKVDLNINK